MVIEPLLCGNHCSTCVFFLSLLPSLAADVVCLLGEAPQMEVESSGEGLSHQGSRRSRLGFKEPRPTASCADWVTHRERESPELHVGTWVLQVSLTYPFWGGCTLSG